MAVVRVVRNGNIHQTTAAAAPYVLNPAPAAAIVATPDRAPAAAQPPRSTAPALSRLPTLPRPARTAGATARDSAAALGAGASPTAARPSLPALTARLGEGGNEPHRRSSPTEQRLRRCRNDTPADGSSTPHDRPRGRVRRVEGAATHHGCDNASSSRLTPSPTPPRAAAPRSCQACCRANSHTPLPPAAAPTGWDGVGMHREWWGTAYCCRIGAVTHRGRRGRTGRREGGQREKKKMRSQAGSGQGTYPARLREGQGVNDTTHRCHDGRVRGARARRAARR